MPETINDTILWTPKELADETGLTIQHIRFLIRMGKINATKVGSRWLISDDDKEDFTNPKQD